MNPTQSRHDQSSWSNLTSLGTTKQVSCSAITTMVLTAGFLTIADEETPLNEKSIQDQEAQMLVHTGRHKDKKLRYPFRTFVRT